MAIFLLGHGFDQLEYRCQKQLLQAWDGKSPLYYWDSVRPPTPLNSTHPEKCSGWNRERCLQTTEQPIWR